MNTIEEYDGYAGWYDRKRNYKKFIKHFSETLCENKILNYF